MPANRTATALLALMASTAVLSTAYAVADVNSSTWPALSGSTIWTSETQPGWVPGSAGVLDFATDGTGVSYEALSQFSDVSDPVAVGESFSWSVSGSSLEIIYEDFASVSFPSVDYPFQEFVDFYGFDQEVTDFLNQAFENGLFNPPANQVQLTLRVVSTTNTIDSQEDGRATVSSTRLSEYSIDEVLTALNWPGALPRGAAVSESESVVYLPAAITNALQNPPAPGDTWAVPHIYEPLDPRVTEATPPGWFIDVFTLDALGTTSPGTLSQRTYSWSATADGLVLEDGNERYTYLPIDNDGSIYLGLATYAVDGDVQLRNAQWITRGDGTGAALVSDLVAPLPLFWQSGINNWIAQFYDEDGQLLPSQVFGYSLVDDGTSFRIFSGTENCLTDASDPCFSAESGTPWTWSAVGDTIVRDRDQGFITRSRTWTALSYQPGERAAVFEWAVWQISSNPAYFAIRPRLTTLEFTSLSEWPEEWADAEGLYPNVDADGDGIADAADNCLQLASAELRDTDGDGIGNVCDSDLNQDCAVDFADLGLFRTAFFQFPDDANWNPDADFNGDSSVNFVDLGILRGQFFAPPGPSGVPNLCD